MKTNALLLSMLLSVPTVASAQVRLEVAVPTPEIRFEAPPPLVEVSPGVQVVPDHEEEIFFSNGHYWTRRHGHWYRTADWRGGWVEAPRRMVPLAVYNIPEGRYRHWHREGAVRAAERREERHEIRAAEHHEAVRAAEHRELRHEERQAERREERHEEQRR